jgi:hypothetical protein
MLEITAAYALSALLKIATKNAIGLTAVAFLHGDRSARVLSSTSRH